MHQIPSLLQFPDQTPVDAVQGVVAFVYERNVRKTQYGEKPVQSCTLKDIAGNSIRVTCWEHPDLLPLKGKEVVLHSTNGKGVKVKHGSYVVKKDGPDKGTTKKTVELDVGKAGCFQTIEVYNQITGGNAAPQSPANAPSAALEAKSPPTPSHHTPQASEPVKTDSRAGSPIFGATVGMAINQACSYLIAKEDNLDPQRVWIIASDIIRIAKRLESGDLYVKPEPIHGNPAAPVKDDGLEPF